MSQNRLHLSLAVLNKQRRNTFPIFLFECHLHWLMLFVWRFERRETRSLFNKLKVKGFWFHKANRFWKLISCGVWSYPFKQILQLLVPFSFVKEQIKVYQMMRGHTLSLTGYNYNPFFLIWRLLAVTKHYKNDLSSCFFTSDPASLIALVLIFMMGNYSLSNIFTRKTSAWASRCMGDYI